ncbi:unnamed protein product [Penicillium bialowiezense]
MDDHAEQPAMHGSPTNTPRDETITPPPMPVAFDQVTEIESFRRVSDTLEDLQSNIDSHMRDIHAQRIDANDAPNQPETPITQETPCKPPSGSSSPDSSPPALLSADQDQLLPLGLYQFPDSPLSDVPEEEAVFPESPRSASSSPDPFRLPIMQFESSPASVASSIGQPVSKPLIDSEPESFEDPIIQFEPTRGLCGKLNWPTSSERESLEVPVMFDVASVRRGLNTESPESSEVPIMLDIASVRALSNPIAIDLSLGLPDPDTFEIGASCAGSSPSTPLKRADKDFNNKPPARPDFSPLRHVSHCSRPATPIPVMASRFNDYFSVGNGHTVYPQTLQRPGPPGCMVQAWPLRQQILVAIPVDQLRPIVTPNDQHQHRVPPWIALTEQGALVRSHPPIRLDGSMESVTQVQWNSSQVPRSSTSAVTSHSANASGLSDTTTPGNASDSAIQSLHTSQHGQPSLIVLPIDSGHPVDTVTVRYQLVFIAPEDLPGLTTPPASSPDTDSDPSRYSFRNNPAFVPGEQPRLRRVGALPRYSSSPSVMSGVPIVSNYEAATSPITSAQASSSTELGQLSSMYHALIQDQEDWHEIETDHTHQDPRATVFLAPLASFVATPSGPPAISPPLPGNLEVVNHAADNSTPLGVETIESGAHSSMEFSDSELPLSSA